MNIHDSFEWTNAIVGGVGLLLTIAAVFQAAGAKRAAIEARSAIRRQSASDAFSEHATTAEKLVNAVQRERPGEAAVRSSDLVAQVARDRARFEGFLAADSVKLKVLDSILLRLAVLLSRGDPLMEKEEIRQALSDAHETSRVLNEICGRLMANRDEEVG
jgi:hypothetical protein